MSKDANLRREANAYVLMLHHGPMTTFRRDAGHIIGRNAGGYAWLSTLHALERRRHVERARGVFYLTEAGATKAHELACLRVMADEIIALPIHVHRGGVA